MKPAGPNGTGNTTRLKYISGLLKPLGGTCSAVQYAVGGNFMFIGQEIMIT